jgi:ABC-type lipoprotein release transport system permease subunit
MNVTRYLLRSVTHHRYAHLGTLAGAILGATVLLGALFAGDSVRASLRRIAAERTGQATHVLTSGDRFFRAALAGDVAAATGSAAAPALLTRGNVVHARTQARVPKVQLVGVTDAFWALAPEPARVAFTPAASAIAVNETLALQLNVTVGDTLVVRLQRPGVVPGSAPIAGGDSSLQTLRCTVAAIVNAGSFGRFSLEATQVPAATVFLPLARLQEAMEQPDRANLVLIDARRATAAPAATLPRVVRLPDYGLSLTWLETARAFEIASPRIFLDDGIAAAITRALPAAQPVTSYLVNEIRRGDRATPYSIGTAVPAAAAPFLPTDLGSREIVLNDWLATDLGASPGDEVTIRYFQTGAAGALTESSASFRVRAVTPLTGLAADRAWMPAFPGITNTSSPRDWEAGLPLDLKRIRPQDDRYWEEHRGTPKAFFSHVAAREMWSTAWGTQTAFRLAEPREREGTVETALLRELRPELGQLAVRDFATAAAGAASPAVDFGGLFAGMSFFLIVAALGLVAMLFQFSLLLRGREDALLAAVGVPATRILRWRLAEGAVLLSLGALAGLPLAVLYTRGILRFLSSIWNPGGGDAFAFAASAASVGGGLAGFLTLSLFALWLALRRSTRRALSVRLAGNAEEAPPPPEAPRRARRFALGSTLTAVAALALSGHGLPPQAAFYLAGFALLAAGLASLRASLATPTGTTAGAALDARRLGALNLRARPSRSLTVTGLIATAVFMVLSVASFRKNVGEAWLRRDSGTGGFALRIETTAPLNPARDRTDGTFDLFTPFAGDLGAVLPLRTGAGDNVNCFNLNTTSQPQLLGVPARRLAELGAFRPKATGAGGVTGWNLLARNDAAGAVPAFVDENTLLWALKRKVGDELEYADEAGRTFRVRIAGTITDSIFQGYLLIDEAALLARFPSHPGYTVFLADAARPDSLTTLVPRLQAAAGDLGGKVETTRDVLAGFHRIENTYLAIFNVLGSLGVVLGSLGLAVVLARNLRERRGEFATLAAVGIPDEVLGRMVRAEYGTLVLRGITIGALAAAVAVGPNLTALPATPTLLLVAGLLAGIVGLNLATGALVFRRAVRDLRPALAQGAD